jgi:hypothetical protein
MEQKDTCSGVLGSYSLITVVLLFFCVALELALLAALLVLLLLARQSVSCTA